jgi:hypothetical protein
MKKIKIVVSKERAEFLLGYKWLSAKTLSVESSETSKDSYDVWIEFPEHYNIDLIAQVLFGAGVSYGLDLNYSSYDNEPSRMR